MGRWFAHACMLAIAAQFALPAPATAKYRADTLRAALKDAGFAIPKALARSDLDRRWTSSSWDDDGKRFVAAIYFEDEIRDEMILGALHLIQVTADGQLTRAIRSDHTLGGAVQSVVVYPDVTIVRKHVSPSAAFLVVLDRSLNHMTTLAGFGADLLTDGSIVFAGNMVHFADYRQQKLMQYSPGTRATVEVYPGKLKSPIQARINDAGRKKLAEMMTEREARNYETDRHITQWDSNPRADRVGLVVSYFHTRLLGEENRDAYQATAIARCDRSGDSWTCQEDTVAVVARRHKVTLPAVASGARDAALRKLVTLELRR